MLLQLGVVLLVIRSINLVQKNRRRSKLRYLLYRVKMVRTKICRDYWGDPTYNLRASSLEKTCTLLNILDTEFSRFSEEEWKLAPDILKEVRHKTSRSTDGWFRASPDQKADIYNTFIGPFDLKEELLIDSSGKLSEIYLTYSISELFLIKDIVCFHNGSFMTKGFYSDFYYHRFSSSFIWENFEKLKKAESILEQQLKKQKR